MDLWYAPEVIEREPNKTYRRYTRFDGETVFQIAYKVLGSQFRWREVMNQNNLSNPLELPWELRICDFGEGR